MPCSGPSVISLAFHELDECEKSRDIYHTEVIRYVDNEERSKRVASHCSDGCKQVKYRLDDTDHLKKTTIQQSDIRYSHADQQKRHKPPYQFVAPELEREKSESDTWLFGQSTFFVVDIGALIPSILAVHAKKADLTTLAVDLYGLNLRRLGVSDDRIDAHTLHNPGLVDLDGPQTTAYVGLGRVDPAGDQRQEAQQEADQDLKDIVSLNGSHL